MDNLGKEWDNKDYYQGKLDKITYAFEDSEVFKRFLRLSSTGAQELQRVFLDLLSQRWIDTARGDNLDNIGEIVGQPRVLVDVDALPYFGYEGAVNAKSYGSLTNPSVGGFYWSLDTPLAGSIMLNDDQYRIFIKAKIFKNVTRGTPEDVIDFIQYVFGARRVHVSIDAGAEQALVLISDDLNSFERAILTYFVETGKFTSYFVPKVLGVGVDFGTLPPDGFFAFEGVIGGLGYGTLVWDEPESIILQLDFVNQEFLVWEESFHIVGGGKYASIF